MGGYKVYSPQLPAMPGELGSFRSKVRGYLTGQLGKEAPAYTGQLAAEMPAYLQNAGALMQNLLNMSTPQGQAQYAPQLIDAQKMIQQMIATGMPVSQAPWYEAAKQAVQASLQYELPQVLEGALGTGTRYTSGLMNKASEAASRRYAELGAQYTQQELAALEAARQRQMQGAQLGAGLAELQMGLPLQALQAAQGLGQTQYEMQQNALNLQYQEWLRRQFANRPEFQAIMQYAMGYPFSAQSPTVAAPLWASLLGNLISAGGTAAAGYFASKGGTAGAGG